MRRTTFYLLGLLVVFAMTALVSARAAAAPAPFVPATVQQQAEQPPADATASQLEATADQLRSRKAYDEAVTYYAAALRKEPKNSVLYNKRGIAELQLNNLGAAKKDFQKALKHNPQYSEAHNNLGVVYYALRDYKKAIRQYEKALQLHEESASVHSNLGTAWFALRRVDKAMAEYARALELDPDVLLRSSSGGLAAQVLSPEDRAYYSYVLAKMYAKRGDVDRCLQCLQKAKDEGYGRLKDVYSDAEFALVRADARFIELMGKPAPE
jgi:tetratricopeptide (TPR) repeat protein